MPKLGVDLSKLLHMAFPGFCWFYMRSKIGVATLGVCFTASSEVLLRLNFVVWHHFLLLHELASRGFAEVCKHILCHPEAIFVKFGILSPCVSDRALG